LPRKEGDDELELDDDDGGKAGGGWLSWALLGIAAETPRYKTTGAG
jgi:hypothetical protein